MSRTRFVLFFLAATALVGCKETGQKEISLKTDQEKFSYVIGQQVGKGMKAQGIEVDPAVLAESITDAVQGKPSRVPPQEAQEVMMKMQQQMMAKQQTAGKEGKEKGDKFLAENKGKKGVQTTQSGLQYEVITEGKGAAPAATDTVKVHYKGTLIDGSTFDSSYDRGQPAEFPLNAVIKGWTEGLQKMKVGSKHKLYVPPELGYGERGQPGIPANSVLIFEVELLAINAKK